MDMVARTRTRKLIWIDKETDEVRRRDRKAGCMVGSLTI